ncbi:para-aminobenzoate synthetase component I [Desulfarculales bacterium]
MSLGGDWLGVLGLPAQPVSLLENRLLEDSADQERCLQLVRGVAALPGACLLLSGGQLDCSRYSLAGWDPLLIFRAKGREMSLAAGHRVWQTQGDPLEALNQIFAQLRPAFAMPREPFAGGGLGYLAYELKNQIERLPQNAVDDLGLPDIYFSFPQQILIHDRQTGCLRYLRLGWPGREPSGPGPLELVKPSAGMPPCLGELSSTFSHPDYLTAVQRIRQYIAQGDVYQVNLSQRFSFDLKGDPLALWERLFLKNPAPFYAYVNAGDHQVLCTSMERFLLRRGSYLETRPIKGTRPRGVDSAADEALRRELSQSFKDDAELSMIVDLLRNDLGRVCSPRSIAVAVHKRVEAFQNVFHLVSTVNGHVDEALTHGQLIAATFPGGSITGCPKIRAMEIIDELEPKVRQVYTGSIGYVGWHQNLDLNIAIRTGIVSQGRCHFAVGGGVVYDSDPEEEYQETLHKGRTLFQVMQDLGTGQP